MLILSWGHILKTTHTEGVKKKNICTLIMSSTYLSQTSFLTSS